MSKKNDVIGKALTWLRTFSDEAVSTIRKVIATEQLEKVDALRVELVKSYGKDHGSMAEDLSCAMVAFQGSADQKKTLKRSLNRAVRKGTNGQYTLAWKRDHAEVVPYKEEQKSTIQRAFDTLAEYAPEDTIDAMVTLFNEGMAILEKDRERVRGLAEQAAAKLAVEREEENRKLGENILRKAGLDITEANLEIAAKIASKM